MVIIITGATHTGKTRLAQRLLEKYNYPYTSIDHIKMGLIRSGLVDLMPEDSDETITEVVWPIVREMIKTAVENSQNLIIEGCYIPFNWMDEFDNNYLSNIRFVCLAFTKKYIDKKFNIIKIHASCIENRLDDELDKEMLKKDNLYYIKGCEEHKLPCLIINDDYESEISSLLV